MASVIFDKARLRAATALMDWTGGTFKVMLCDNTYSPVVADEFVADGAAAKELTDATYLANGTAGRITLANAAATIVANRAECQADNVTYAGILNETIGWVVVYEHVTNDADSLVVCAIDLADIVTVGTDITIKWDGGATAGAVFKL